MKGDPKKTGIAAVIIILVLGIIYFLYDPSTSIYFPKCPFLLLTGYPCPGCGSQRAIHSLLHLDIKGALHYKFVMTLLLPVIIILLYASFQREKHPRFYLLTHNRYVAYSLFIIIMGWWALRIIFGW